MRAVFTAAHSGTRPREGDGRQASIPPLLPASSSWRIAALWLVLGLLLGFHPILRHGLELPLSGYADSELTSFLLEHAHRGVVRNGNPASIWHPPIFYPFPESGALSETLVGVLPFYSPVRFLGASPAEAALMAQLLMSATTFVLAFLLFRRGLDASPSEAGFAAFLVAFGSSKMARIYHLQLFAQVPLFLGLLVLQRPLRSEAVSTLSRAGIVALGVLAVAQVFSCLYVVLLALLLAFGTLPFLIAFPHERQRILRLVADRWPAWLGVVLVTGFLILPVFGHYSAAAAAVDRPSAARLADLLPPPLAVLNSGERSWLGAPFAAWTGIPQGPFPWEFSVGLGFATSALVLAGLPAGWRRPWVRCLAAGALTTWLVIVRWPGGISIWGSLLEVFPPLAVVRAISRIHLLILPVVAALAILGLRAVRSRWGPLAAALAMLIAVAEQGRTWGMQANASAVPAENLAALSAQFPTDCDAFFLSAVGEQAMGPHLHLAAMWLALSTEVPTVNGYSGYPPRNWRLNRAYEGNPGDGDISQRLWSWLDSSDFRGELCWLRVETGSGEHRPPVERMGRP